MRAVKVLSHDGTYLGLCSRTQARRMVRRQKAVWHGNVYLHMKENEQPPVVRPIHTGKVLASKLYGNCRVLSPDGDTMFHCNQEKLDWYLTRNLAEQIDALTIKLKFMPKGPGHQGDDYYLTPKENKCVCCGLDQDLTRHHVIPACYRKYFPWELKSHSYHDILLMCVDCHEKYERFADALKVEIANEYGVPVHGDSPGIDKDALRAKKSAHALKVFGHQIPEPRHGKLMDDLRSYFKKTDIGPEDIEAAWNFDIDNSPEVTHGEHVVANTPDLEAFVKRWRKHFIDNMNPQFLPKFWDQDRAIAKS